MNIKNSVGDLTAVNACVGGEGILANPSSPRSTCGNCRWWYLYDFEKSQPIPKGYCRLRAPVVVPYGDGWPRTSAAQWCGEHSRIPAPPAADRST